MTPKSIDELLDNKSVPTSDLIRPSVFVERNVWEEFLHTLDYVNLKRPEPLRPGAAVEGMLVKFERDVEARVVRDEGNLKQLERFRHDKREEKRVQKDHKDQKVRMRELVEPARFERDLDRKANRVTENLALEAQKGRVKARKEDE